MKDWLTTELARNKGSGDLYVRLLRRAFRDLKDLQVIIAHHLTVEYEGRLDTVDEIPSADTMMFDHEIMGKVFGDRAQLVMMDLAIAPVKDGARDRVLEKWMKEVK